VTVEMLRKFAAALLHLSMFALVCAIATYWVIRILTPAPASAPPPQPAAVLREPDPMLAARMFGLVQAAPVKMALNVQALGVYAAGKDSAAVLVVDGKPARVYLMNQEVANGARLVEVRKDAVTIEQGGVRRDVALPPPQHLGLGGNPPPPGYTREGATLTAPSVAGGTQPAAPPRPMQARPSVVQQPLPQQPVQQPPMQPQPMPPQPQAQPQGAQPDQDEETATDSAPAPTRRRSPGRPLSQ
jgi:general secretion pathway protein C